MLVKLLVFIYLYVKSLKDSIFRSQNRVYQQLIFGLNFIDLQIFTIPLLNVIFSTILGGYSEFKIS